MRFASRTLALAAATAALALPLLTAGPASASRAIALSPCDPPLNALAYQLITIDLPLLAPENMGSVGSGGVQNIC
jgi:hypothetical protein